MVVQFSERDDAPPDVSAGSSNLDVESGGEPSDGSSPAGRRGSGTPVRIEPLRSGITFVVKEGQEGFEGPSDDISSPLPPRRSARTGSRRGNSGTIGARAFKKITSTVGFAKRLTQTGGATIAPVDDLDHEDNHTVPEWLYPFSTFRNCWDLFVTAVVSYNCFYSPIQVSLFRISVSPYCSHLPAVAPVDVCPSSPTRRC